MEFNSFDFTGGMLTIQPDASKIPNGSYRIAKNIRVRDNVVQPVASPVDVTKNLVATHIQGSHEMGIWTIVFVGGVAYICNMDDPTNGWVPLSGYRLDASAENIYTEVVPMSFNAYKRTNKGPTDASLPQIANQFYSDQGGGIPCMIAQDGINPPMLIHPDASGYSFTCRQAGTYTTWTPENPEYVPIGYQMAWDGQRLHIVLQGRFAYEKKRLVGRSVNNRPLDFMVALDSDGNKVAPETEGDARITSYGVDFDEITALTVVNNSQPAVLVCTLKNIWQASPDFAVTEATFGEPVFRPVLVASTGVIGQNVFAQINGDTAFVSQAGIRSINATAQNRFEGRNFPLSKEISRILQGKVQTLGAAIGFNDYAYFSVSTVHGNVIVVYDTILGKWVSVDTYVSDVVKFLVIRKPGLQRLVAVTRTKVYILEEGTTYDAGIYVGDYSSPASQSIRMELLPTALKLNFINNRMVGTVNVDMYNDDTKSSYVSDSIPVATPSSSTSTFPYESHGDDSATITFSLRNTWECFRHGYWITWNNSSALSYVTSDASESTLLTDRAQRVRKFNELA